MKNFQVGDDEEKKNQNALISPELKLFLTAHLNSSVSKFNPHHDLLPHSLGNVKTEFINVKSTSKKRGLNNSFLGTQRTNLNEICRNLSQLKTGRNSS